MDTLMLIFSGSVIAGLVYKKQFSLFLDILFGILGALAGYLLISNISLPMFSAIHFLSYFFAIISSVSIIHIGRLFENLSLS